MAHIVKKTREMESGKEHSYLYVYQSHYNKGKRSQEFIAYLGPTTAYICKKCNRIYKNISDKKCNHQKRSLVSLNSKKGRKIALSMYE